MLSGAENLNEEALEHATATANLVACALTRLECEYGIEAVREAWRLVLSAVPRDEHLLALLVAIATVPA